MTPPSPSSPQPVERDDNVRVRPVSPPPRLKPSTIVRVRPPTFTFKIGKDSAILQPVSPSSSPRPRNLKIVMHAFWNNYKKSKEEADADADDADADDADAITDTAAESSSTSVILENPAARAIAEPSTAPGFYKGQTAEQQVETALGVFGRDYFNDQTPIHRSRVAEINTVYNRNKHNTNAHQGQIVRVAAFMLQKDAGNPKMKELVDYILANRVV